MTGASSPKKPAELALPLVAFVTDGHQNPVSGAPVTFAVVAGGGSFAGAASAVALTDSSGLTSARLTFAPAAGFDNHRVEASFPCMAGLPARSDHDPANLVQTLWLSEIWCG